MIPVKFRWPSDSQCESDQLSGQRKLGIVERRSVAKESGLYLRLISIYSKQHDLVKRLRREVREVEAPVEFWNGEGYKREKKRKTRTPIRTQGE